MSDPTRTADHVPEPTPARDHPPAAPSTAAGGTSTPSPSADAFAARLEALAGGTPGDDLPEVAWYEIVGEIARGGMGVVYAATDAAFGRWVAVKTLLPKYAGRPDLAAQFDREADITACLSHPGIPPIHARDRLADGRPFLVMKLIGGRTLADELAAPDRVVNLPRLLGVFEQICQTVGFAHAQGIIHRDLKPSNVMVGEFGEVQVMDWGLAKALASRERERPEDVAPVAHAPGSPESTIAGSAKGTPAFMPPEQARGEWDAVDSRADVFALGGILAVILTGEPPFTGRNSHEMFKRAAAADLGDAFARLDACGADADLIALCKWCLSAAPADRPTDGKAVAEAVAAYRAGVEERARRAEADRAAAEAEAREQRKRRRVQLALFAAVVAAVGLAAVGAWVTGKRNAERIAAAGKAENARERIQSLLALSTELRKEYRFTAAANALRQAGELAGQFAPDLGPEVERAKSDLAFVTALDGIRFRKWAVVVRPGGQWDFDTKIAPPEYRAAFAGRGLDLTALDPAEAAGRIAASPVKAALVAAVDDWALYEPAAPLRDRLLGVARVADPHPWRDRLRDPAGWADRAAVEGLAADCPADAPPAALTVLAQVMRRQGLDPGTLLAVARARHPTDFELAFALGQSPGADGKGGQQVEAYEAARAIRPDNLSVWVNLANALVTRGDLDVAAAVCGEALRLDPGCAMVHSNLGIVLAYQGDAERAIARCTEAVRLDPRDVSLHFNLVAVYILLEKYPEAIARARANIALAPADADLHGQLGQALLRAGDIAGARAAYAEAARLAPDRFGGLARLVARLVAGPPREVKR